MAKDLIVRSIGGTAFIGLLLFAPYGTVRWPAAWVFLAIFIVCSVATAFWLKVTDPGLLAARMQSPLSRDQTPRDRAVMLIILIAFMVWLVFIAIDARRGWSPVRPWVQAIGALLVLGAFGGWVTVMRANSFAAVNVRLQRERSQTVVSTGPYAVIRHPMYGYTVLLLVGAPLLLGSLWGVLAGLVVLMPLFAVRALGEEAMLMEGLAGYRDYAARVRYRLVPGIW